jgi:aryl-alcohol dehydrogenase-like predicted oxidoreductase
MMKIQLGRSGFKIPVVGFGAWQAGKVGWGNDYSDGDIIDAIRYSLKNGGNHIDTAEVYGMGHSEELVRAATENLQRKDFIIATKVAPPHFRYKDVIKACENSLKRLGTDYIDLYQLHWPDNYVPLKETLAAMEKLADEGLIRHIGVCNFPAPLIRETINLLKDHDLVSNQMRYNILQREVEDETYPLMKEHGITMIAYSPIAKGLLTCKYDEGHLPPGEIRSSDPLFRKENLKGMSGLFERLRELSDKYKCEPGTVALAYLIQKGAAVIPGAKNMEQVKENLVAGDLQLTQDEVKSLEMSIDLDYF